MLKIQRFIKDYSPEFGHWASKSTLVALALSVRSNRFQQHSTTNDRIESLNNGQMTFRYRKSGEQRDRVMTLPVFKFLRRIRAPPLNQRDTRPRRMPEHSF